MRVRRIALAGAFGALLGAVLAIAWVAIGGDGALVPSVVGTVLAFAIVRWWMRRTFPRRALAAARRHLDPAAGPPPGAEPVEPAIVERWLSAGARRDWDALRALHAEDFRFHSPGLRRPMKLRRFMRLQRVRARRLGPSRTTLEQAFSDPHRPDTFWVRLHQHSEPPHGGALDLTRWESWTLTPAGDRIQTRTVVTFTHAAEAAGAGRRGRRPRRATASSWRA